MRPEDFYLYPLHPVEPGVGWAVPQPGGNTRPAPRPVPRPLPLPPPRPAPPSRGGGPIGGGVERAPRRTVPPPVAPAPLLPLVSPAPGRAPAPTFAPPMMAPPEPEFVLPDTELGRFVRSHYADALREQVFRRLLIAEVDPSMLAGVRREARRRRGRRPRPRPRRQRRGGTPPVVVEE
jgi:hypothetical protein